MKEDRSERTREEESKMEGEGEAREEMRREVKREGEREREEEEIGRHHLSGLAQNQNFDKFESQKESNNLHLELKIESPSVFSPFASTVPSSAPVPSPLPSSPLLAPSLSPSSPLPPSLQQLNENSAPSSILSPNIFLPLPTPSLSPPPSTSPALSQPSPVVSPSLSLHHTLLLSQPTQSLSPPLSTSPAHAQHSPTISPTLQPLLQLSSPLSPNNSQPRYFAGESERETGEGRRDENGKERGEVGRLRKKGGWIREKKRKLKRERTKEGKSKMAKKTRSLVSLNQAENQTRRDLSREEDEREGKLGEEKRVEQPHAKEVLPFPQEKKMAEKFEPGLTVPLEKSVEETLGKGINVPPPSLSLSASAACTVLESRCTDNFLNAGSTSSSLTSSPCSTSLLSLLSMNGSFAPSFSLPSPRPPTSSSLHSYSFSSTLPPTFSPSHSLPERQQSGHLSPLPSVPPTFSLALPLSLPTQTSNKREKEKNHHPLSLSSSTSFYDSLFSPYQKKSSCSSHLSSPFSSSPGLSSPSFLPFTPPSVQPSLPCLPPSLFVPSVPLSSPSSALPLTPHSIPSPTPSLSLSLPFSPPSLPSSCARVDSNGWEWREREKEERRREVKRRMGENEGGRSERRNEREGDVSKAIKGLHEPYLSLPTPFKVPQTHVFSDLKPSLHNSSPSASKSVNRTPKKNQTERSKEGRRDEEFDWEGGGEREEEEEDEYFPPSWKAPLPPPARFSPALSSALLRLPYPFSSSPALPSASLRPASLLSPSSVISQSPLEALGELLQREGKKRGRKRKGAGGKGETISAPERTEEKKPKKFVSNPSLLLLPRAPLSASFPPAHSPSPSPSSFHLSHPLSSLLPPKPPSPSPFLSSSLHPSRPLASLPPTKAPSPSPSLSSSLRSRRAERRKWNSAAAFSLKGESGSELLRTNPLLSRTKQLRFSRSLIHGWGLLAAEKIEKEDFIVEYTGEVIRRVVSDLREKRYEKNGMGSSYLFRIDDEFVVDATVRGGIARFINHSCDPNCYTKIILSGGDKHVCIYAKRPIFAGDELTYDYKFPREEEKIPCHCGAKKCRGTMN